ncbi:MAG TPA: asparagine synthase (glutamine-hydrolyzing) [Chloroflexia bacterium]|nr:asparagine synthase (glutamine-hydrolyzing) [Chloroflexia bacterium]
MACRAHRVFAQVMGVAYTGAMCGIAGIYNVDGQPPERTTLARMARLLAHRGPDGERFFTQDGVGLAHRHLRIIDLTDAAMQPMASADGLLQLIFNGEIYNYIELRAELELRGHRFSTRSDTEVILHAYQRWGTSCLHRFNGMFAFALWDSAEKRLFIARDRIGVKPLYYSWDGRRLAFASEIKALLAVPSQERRPHLPAVAEYMSAMYTTGDKTWFEGIKRLLPGHYMLASREGLKVSRWWNLPESEDEPGRRTETYYVTRTRELLEDSVRLRLRSDVPLGAHLSGGIDSSSVVALLSAATHAPVRTFSGAFSTGPRYDERRYANMVARRYRTEHHETLPVAADLKNVFDTITWHMDEPAAGPGILLQWAVCKLTAEAGVRVINGGQGGDEMWGGYYGYVPTYLRTVACQVRRHPHLARTLLASTAQLVGSSPLRNGLVNAVLRRRSGRLKPDDALCSWAGHKLRELSFDEGDSSTVTVDEPDSGATPLASLMRWDQRWYLPALLQVEDRTSMAFSLESRAPLLDYRLVEHAATVPSAMRLKGLTLKYILREAVRDLLPPQVYRRQDKMGMPTPISIWFRRELAGWVREQLLGSGESSSLVDRQYAEQTLEVHTLGREDRSIELWKMLCLSAWWRIYIEGDPIAIAQERPEPALAGSVE